MDESDEPSLGMDLGPAPGAAAQAEYKVLARKYRPSDFTGLIGQEALVRTLSNAFATGRIAHAFMLTGVRGVGKTTTARIIARALNCIGADGKGTGPTIQPCGVCEPCRAIAESRHVDVQEMDAASRTGIDDVREIIEGVRYAPASARYKVYIIDEVHMLSKQAFNGLLKTLEEPPPHVKFVFATTEIRKVPVTVLSRCQRFDLRRIETPELMRHLGNIAEKEGVKIEEAALALVARAAEGSVRDSLSLLDQAIAHGTEEIITADVIRGMLGLADRGRVLDLFEKVMSGNMPEALTQLGELYDRGADPMAVLQDLLEIVHFLTRIKVAPGAEGFFDGASSEAKRSAEMAGKLSVPSLTRAWTMLLKGLFEVRDAARPVQALEMALIRLAYAADLPPTDKLVRDLMDGGAAPAGRGAPAPSGAPGSGPRMAVSNERPQAMAAVQPMAMASQAPVFKSLEDLAAFAQKNNAPLLRFQLENNVHLVKLEPGRLEFRPARHAPPSLAADLAQKLKDWTGTRWLVTVAREGGAPTLAEQKQAVKQARYEAVLQQPIVRAVLDRFPGAEIMAVRDVAGEDTAAPMPESDSDSDDE
ncbi:DNA polymerase-3 subunit gamma/tau [Rhizomicrobium palustre]|uniref:DNA polymerase III subunit gamma/tau n=1 Tax=Rhizomicrobium palustre TaxID=189966 RepID=A0A846MXY0_9PROT|nr:DNA polymerase III subunit gamma/tau [Rhizomicrobium palustre]NIK87870.1 DNA polymerase-3 subunit gamma/tau [Rhizomicrobium palustre]